jgi:zona occludens toxin (predicted ATPase)
MYKKDSQNFLWNSEKIIFSLVLQGVLIVYLFWKRTKRKYIERKYPFMDKKNNENERN